MTESLDSTIDLILGNTPQIRDGSSEEIYEALLKIHQAIEILVSSYDDSGGTYVTIGTVQSITAEKTFDDTVNFDGSTVFDISATFNGGTNLPFNGSFTSAEQTITSAGSLVLAHSLSVTPTLIQARLICKTAQAGYSIGDEVIINLAGNDPGATNNRGLSIVPDATNINIRYGSDTFSFSILRKDTGAAATITNTNWRLIIKAWA